MLPSWAAQNASIRHTNYIDDQLYLFSLVGTWEEGKAREEFNQDAS